VRNISFALTTDQVVNGTKTVTRRMGWKFLKPGDLLQPVRKCMGLRPGEKLEKLRGPIRVLSVRRESLWRMWREWNYGEEECRLEGFSSMTPFDFIDMFCASHKGCNRGSEVTRIEFEYLPAVQHSEDTK